MSDRRWTLCSCKHLAQDHNIDGLCEFYNCKCEKYDGKEVK